LPTAKGVAQHSEGSRRIAKALCRFGGSHLVQEIGPQRLVLALVRGCGLLEEAPTFC